MKAEVFIQYLTGMRNLDDTHNLEGFGAFLSQIMENPNIAKHSSSQLL